jgi:Rrf2 family protein
MRLSLQVRYAICGVFDLAYNAEDGPVQIRVIGERQAIPPRYLEQIFQRLRHAELVSSKRGPGGGYMLARPPAEITLRDVVEAVEGPLGRRAPAPRRSRAGAGGASDGGDASVTPFQPGFLWGALAEQMGRMLAATTIEALCREAAKARVARVQPEAPMYHI